MPLAPATRLGPYEIVAPLGAGGMGEVYRARDSRLGRDVALKVLPSEVSADPARRARFEQEGRAAAALSHPNIVGLYDVGDAGGAFFIVSELVPGETLSAILERGPLPTRKLLDLAAQIADGMAAAHAAQIAHRDLKPANIIVTPEGRAKILDFGLAKRAGLAPSTPDETLTVHQTEPGMILGTIHYMSPEQARGKPADYRSDQFSFGVILYEMATGRKAFDKPESVQTMSAILSEDPPPIERDIPAPLRWTIGRCLAKDPAERYESSRDLARELSHIRDHITQSTSASQPAVAAPLQPRRRIRWALPLLVALGLAGAFLAGRQFAGPRSPDQSSYRFMPFAFDPGGQGSPVWSPDGKAIAYSGYPDGPGKPYQVMARSLDGAMPQRITRLNESAYPLAWAPDSMRLVFRSSHAPAGLWTVSAVGGEPESFFPFENNRAIAVSPDLKSVAFVRQDSDLFYYVWISSPPGATPRKYEPNPIRSRGLFNETRVGFSPDGKSILLLFRSDRGRDETWRLPYPPGSGAPKQVLPDLRTYGGTAGFAWMPDNRRVLLTFTPTPESANQLWLADLENNRQRALTSGTASFSATSVSPDGSRIVLTENTGSFDIVSVDLDTGAAEKMISTERTESMPAWAASEAALVYTTDRDGPYEIWFRNHAGDRAIVRPRDFTDGNTQWFMGPALSPDGGRVAYTRIEWNGGSRLWISSVSGGAPIRMTNDQTSAEFPGSWSNDASQFVYLAVRNGKLDLMKIKASGQATPVTVLESVDCETPSWSPDGNWIVCGRRLISPDGKTVREMPDRHTANYTFSKDGKLLYGIREEADGETLFSVNVASGAEKTIGSLAREFRPASNLRPAIRFSLAPNGRSLVYSAGTFHSNLWILSGALTP